MKIISVILEENNETKIITDIGTEIILNLKEYFRIPQKAMKIDFKNEDELKNFCIQYQIMDY